MGSEILSGLYKEAKDAKHLNRRSTTKYAREAKKAMGKEINSYGIVARSFLCLQAHRNAQRHKELNLDKSP